MPGKQRLPVTAARKATNKKTKQVSATAASATASMPLPPSSRKAAQNGGPTSTPSESRKRVAPSTNEGAGIKKQKTKDLRATPTTSSSTTETDAAAGGVVPATPGTRVNTPSTPQEVTTHTAGQDARKVVLCKRQNQQNKTKPKNTRKTKKTKDTGQQQQQQPSTLPLEPHTAILAELRPRRDVLVLSVLSSSKMEKRIAAILSHLGKPSSVGPPESAAAQDTPPAASPPLPPPGVVLLHARAADSGKLISIAEIAKRRIREGFYREDTQGDGHTAAVVWYQYNRLYDVQTEVKGVRKNSEDNEGNEDSEDDDGFEPMPRRFQEAVGDAAAKQTATRTYMSTILSRVALPELLKHSDITCQASVDPIETEYQSWMTPGA